MFKRLVTLSLLLLFISQAHSNADDIFIDGVPLPKRFATADLNSSSSAFTGAWFGTWDGAIKSILLIESVGEDSELRATYAISSNAQRGLEANWQ